MGGGHDGHPTFRIALWHHIQRAMGPLADDPRIRLWLYVDDIVLQAAPTAWADLWHSMTVALREAHFELCPEKPAWYCPHQQPPVGGAQDYRAIFNAAGIAEARGGISILGTEATHLETETFVAQTAAEGGTPHDNIVTQRAITGPMHRRLHRALRLNRRVTQLATTTTQAGAAQPAWTITRLVTAHTLDYDFRALPVALTTPAAEILWTALLTAVTAAIGADRLTAEQEIQIFLPTQYAGLQLQCPATTAPLARAAHLIENGHLDPTGLLAL